MIETVLLLAERSIELGGLKENIDTTTATGKLMFYIMAALAEFERDLISKRTLAGLEAARARGHKGDRPAATKKISAATLSHACELYAERAMSVAEIMKRTGFRSRTTFYKYVVNGEKSIIRKVASSRMKAQEHRSVAARLPIEPSCFTFWKALE